MKKLSEIQNLMQVKKNEYNSFGKYKYRTAEAIYNEAKKYLIELNCSLFVKDSIIKINGLIVIKAIATIKDNSTLEQVTVEAFAGVDTQSKGMHLAQCFGASSSYARKYALSGLFLLDDSENDIDSKDSTNYKSTEEILKAKKNYFEPKQKKQFTKDNFLSALSKNATIKDIKKYYEISAEIEKEYLNEYLRQTMEPTHLAEKPLVFDTQGDIII